MLLLATLLFATPAVLEPCFEDRPPPFVESIASPVEEAFRLSLAAELRAAHTHVVKWSEARKWIYAYYAKDDGSGLVWDAYGQDWLRGPALGMDEKLVNVEHTWPRSRFGGWDGEARITEEIEKALKGDLHNLFPTEEVLNSERANKPFAEVGDCDPLESCSSDEAFEPPDAHKGDAARAMFYMAVRYGYSVPDEMERTLRAWDLGDPPDAAERRRNDDIAAVQGNRNPFVDEPDLVSRIGDL